MPTLIACSLSVFHSLINCASVSFCSVFIFCPPLSLWHFATPQSCLRSPENANIYAKSCRGRVLGVTPPRTRGQGCSTKP
jgi:hypothetical protein